MQLNNEKQVIELLADKVMRAGATLFRATQYIYALCGESFYSCNTEDIFKIALNNLFDADMLSCLRLDLSSPFCGCINGPAYKNVYSLILYSLAVRLPVLKTVGDKATALSDQQLRAVYQAVLSKGVKNHADAVSESFDENLGLVKKGRELPVYNADWYKTYLYQNLPELTRLANANLLLLGAADVLFVMFYFRFEEELKQTVAKLLQMQAGRDNAKS